jgi:hypothetical protein
VDGWWCGWVVGWIRWTRYVTNTASGHATQLFSNELNLVQRQAIHPIRSSNYITQWNNLCSW